MLPLPPGFDEMEFIYGNNPVTGVKTYYGTFFYSTSSKTGLFIFSGTATYTDWLEDLSYFQVYPSKINNMVSLGSTPLVHRGFYNIYESVRDQIFNIVVKHTFSQIIVSGHSLGGALATLCAIDLYEPNKTGEDIFLFNETFAAPRVGNVAFANIVDGYLKYQYRVYNTEDLVTQMPPAVLPSSLYEQTGIGVGFTSNLGSLDANHVMAYEKELYT
jgi:triacylglycerol lipase